MNQPDKTTFVPERNSLTEDQKKYLTILSILRSFDGNSAQRLVQYMVREKLFQQDLRLLGQDNFLSEHMFTQPEKKYVSEEENDERLILEKKLGMQLRAQAKDEDKAIAARFIIDEILYDGKDCKMEPALENLLLSGHIISSLGESFTDRDRIRFIHACDQLKSHERAAKGGVWSIWLTQAARNMRLNLSSPECEEGLAKGL